MNVWFTSSHHHHSHRHDHYGHRVRQHLSAKFLFFKNDQLKVIVLMDWSSVLTATYARAAIGTSEIMRSIDHCFLIDPQLQRRIPPGIPIHRQDPRHVPFVEDSQVSMLLRTERGREISDR